MEKNFTEFHFVERERIRNVIFKSCLRTSEKRGSQDEAGGARETERQGGEQKIKLQTMKHKRNNNNKNMLNKYIYAFNIQTTMKIDFFLLLLLRVAFWHSFCSFRIPWSSSVVERAPVQLEKQKTLNSNSWTRFSLFFFF